MHADGGHDGCRGSASAKIVQNGILCTSLYGKEVSWWTPLHFALKCYLRRRAWKVDRFQERVPMHRQRFRRHFRFIEFIGARLVSTSV
jgi:hypothetical protein